MGRFWQFFISIEVIVPACHVGDGLNSPVGRHGNIWASQVVLVVNEGIAARPVEAEVEAGGRGASCKARQPFSG